MKGVSADRHPATNLERKPTFTEGALPNKEPFNENWFGNQQIEEAAAKEQELSTVCDPFEELDPAVLIRPSIQASIAKHYGMECLKIECEINLLNIPRPCEIPQNDPEALADWSGYPQEESDDDDFTTPLERLALLLKRQGLRIRSLTERLKDHWPFNKIGQSDDSDVSVDIEGLGYSARDVSLEPTAD